MQDIETGSYWCAKAFFYFTFDNKYLIKKA